MKKNELIDLKSKTKDELTKLLYEAREEIGKFKIELSMNKSKNVNQMRNKMKQVARILTFLSLKEEA